MGQLDLCLLQDGFASLVKQADTDHLPSFFLWLDLKVAQFKISGNFIPDKELAIQKIWIQHATRRLFDTNDKPLKLFANGSGLVTPTKTESSSSSHDHATNNANSTRTFPEDDGIMPLSLSRSPRYDARVIRDGGVGATGVTDPDLRRVMLRVPILLAQEPTPAPQPVLEPLDFSCVEKKTQTEGKDTVRSLLREALCKSRNVAPVEVKPASVAGKSASESVGAEKSSEKEAKSDESPVRTVGDEVEKNSCPYCSKTFQYRSSYRRHVKIHQGIFSHMCYVCGRKFTRKEHFVRHKCNRRPNKPNRGGGQDPGHHDLDPSGSGVFPPDCLLHMDLEGQEVATDLDETKLSIKLESRDDDFEVGFVDEVTDEEFSRLHESRRKSSTPRKVVVANESSSDVSDAEQPDFIGKRDLSESFFSEKGAEEEDEGNVVARRREIIEGFLVPRGNEPTSDDDDGRDIEFTSNGPLSMEGIPPPTRGGLHSIPGTPEKSAAFGPSSGFLNLQTGSYKVEEIDDDNDAMSDSGTTKATMGKVITIKKQAKYLKLKNEAHIVDGNLCFSCPHCFKTFHRSSNFSRHMRIHRGVYSYICQTCSRGFFRREHFQKHKCHRKSMSTVCDRRTKFELLQGNAESGDAGSPLLENSGDFGEWPLTSSFHVVADSATSLLIPTSVETTAQ